MGRRRAWVSWSGGKDGAFALHEMRERGDVEVEGLLTTLDGGADAVAMSLVPSGLVQQQATALGLPLRLVELPWPCPNGVYEARTGEALAGIRSGGTDEVVFGDLFLADIRAYRERTLLASGLAPRFPLWGRPTADLARSMISCGLRAVVVCADPTRVPAGLVGRWWDEELVHELPDGVDPCGENGEFHTFVTDGPGFAHAVDVVVGGTTERDGFVHATLRAGEGAAGPSG